MRLLDEQYLATPFYGALRMTSWLNRLGHGVNVKRVRRLLRVMGLEAIYPKPRKTLTSIADPAARTYPYLLKGLVIDRPDQVWATDITYVPLTTGWAYLVAIMDWVSRHVIAWELSVTLEADFWLTALEQALATGRQPEIFNSDQGCQFTSAAFTGRLADARIAISRDGRGRAFDNIFVERLWRTVKYEDVYIHDYQTPAEARLGFSRYFSFYNFQRLHQALDYRTPAEVYGADGAANSTTGSIVSSLTLASNTNSGGGLNYYGGTRTTGGGSGGTLTLSGSNTYTGPPTITNGLLLVSSNANLGGVTAGINFNSGTLRPTSSMTFGSGAVNRNIAVISGTGVNNYLDTGSNNAFLIGGNITSTNGGSLSLVGSGKVTFNGVASAPIYVGGSSQVAARM